MFEGIANLWRKLSETTPAVAAAESVIADDRTVKGDDRMWGALVGLNQPGCKAAQPVVVEPVESTGTTAEPPAVQPIDQPMDDPDTAPIDWEAEKSTTLPPRNARRIQFLLQFETPAQTQERILSDKMRVANARAGRTVPNMQSCIIPAETVWSSTPTFVRR